MKIGKSFATCFHHANCSGFLASRGNGRKFQSLAKGLKQHRDDAFHSHIISLVSYAAQSRADFNHSHARLRTTSWVSRPASTASIPFIKQTLKRSLLCLINAEIEFPHRHHSMISLQLGYQNAINLRFALSRVPLGPLVCIVGVLSVRGRQSRLIAFHVD